MALQRLRIDVGNEPLHQLLLRDDLDFDAPYQRGLVWGLDRKRALVRSLLMNLPIGGVYINDRGYDTGRVDSHRVVVDGKQRLTTLNEFWTDKFTVSADWFDEADLADVEYEDDGQFVYCSGLTARGKGKFTRNPIVVYRTQYPDVAAEQVLFDLINFGGVPQGDTDL